MDVFSSDVSSENTPPCVFKKRRYAYTLAQCIVVTQYLGCITRLFIHFKYITHPKILGHTALS